MAVGCRRKPEACWDWNKGGRSKTSGRRGACFRRWSGGEEEVESCWHREDIIFMFVFVRDSSTDGVYGVPLPCTPSPPRSCSDGGGCNWARRKRLTKSSWQCQLSAALGLVEKNILIGLMFGAPMYKIRTQWHQSTHSWPRSHFGCTGLLWNKTVHSFIYPSIHLPTHPLNIHWEPIEYQVLF